MSFKGGEEGGEVGRVLLPTITAIAADQSSGRFMKDCSDHTCSCTAVLLLLHDTLSNAMQVDCCAIMSCLITQHKSRITAHSARRAAAAAAVRVSHTGLDAPTASPQEVAKYTTRTMLRT